MNTFFTLLAILLFLPATGISQTKAEKQARKESFKNRDKYLFAARPVQKDFTHTLPFDYHLGQIIVPVVIKGKTYSFMFDTGAATIVSSDLKDELGMNTIFSNNMADGSGQVEVMRFYGIGDLQLGPVVFKDVVGTAIDMKKFEKLFCMKLDGIFGTNIMRTCHWKIDYKAKTITFSDKRIRPEGEVTEIGFTENFSGSPLIEQVIGRYSFHSTMDTGYNGGFKIRDSLFFDTRKSKDIKMVRGRGKSSMTLFDSKIDYEYAAILDTIGLGGHLLKNQFVSVAAGDSYLIGNELFEKYGTVILDWHKKKLYLGAKDIKEDKYFKTLGISPLYIGDALHVGMVWENSVAARNGVEPGDAIISINGIPSKNMQQEQWCAIVDLLRNADADIKVPMVVQGENGEEKQFVLEKTDLFNP
ncbi:aspartyl protease family protein [Flavobacterium sp. MFBS3-15]|uniref:aspartyl protease family protein n=1 Tax=Flavobacterium sp. MFBS3-15 TaxID=2989816 RepID=UPI0022361B88|nr:aspartyl protease family protein [Flavobacterium sp. MFBS3-15]MCW4470477.1 aspartyl protease family protein [Flavobacterium sp. MFBS3-15]